jgi:serine/threonine protein kinase
MICKNCHFDNPDDAEYCKECGMVLCEKTVVLDTGTQSVVDPLCFSPGEHFGDRYQIIEEIGQGGMGKVFKARDNELNIVVALKMIKPELSADPNIVSRFKKELLLAREILHENVIRIHDLGEINGIKYISMNYIEGNSLQEILQSTGKLTIEKSIDITKQVCSALSAAHNKGIIHRDLKPQNIMIDKKGKALVLDFGIARSLDSDSGTTQEGIVLGTPYFMSPEQIMGERVDASTDIYSLGIIMYETVTGKLPFTADSSTTLLHMHLSEKPKPPSQLNPHIPPMLERIILKCLEKKQRNRYRAIDEIMKDLEQDKTVQIPKLKIKEKKESRLGRNIRKHGLRAFLFLFIVYAVMSILSLVNDFIYKTKIEKLEVKYDTHYKNYFPVQKDWLPADWEARECNGWDIYIELFPPKTDKEGNPIPLSQYLENEYAKNILANPLAKPFDTITNRFEYKNVEVLKNIAANYGKFFKTNRLFDAVKCSRLNPLGASQTQRDRMLYLPMVEKYAEMTALDARIHFLEGDYETGMRKLYNFTIFTMDLFASSTYLVEDQMALTCFYKMCCELIPGLLCRKMTIGSLSHYELDSLKAFGEIIKRGSPETSNADSPPISEENIEAAMTIMESFETLIFAALKKFEPHAIFEKEYVNLINDYGDIYRKFDMKELDYHIYEKLRPMFWRHWFSINRYFYKEGIEFYDQLLSRIKLTRDMHDKRMIINEYFKEHTTDDSIIIANVAHSAFILNLSRTFGKLVLIIYTMNTYGLDSKEFLDLKATDLFINELSGNKFEMTGEAPGYSIVLDKNLNLNLKKINYKEDHKKILQSFKHFDLKPGK